MRQDSGGPARSTIALTNIYGAKGVASFRPLAVTRQRRNENVTYWIHATFDHNFIGQHNRAVISAFEFPIIAYRHDLK